MISIKARNWAQKTCTSRRNLSVHRIWNISNRLQIVLEVDVRIHKARTFCHCKFCINVFTIFIFFYFIYHRSYISLLRARRETLCQGAATFTAIAFSSATYYLKYTDFTGGSVLVRQRVIRSAYFVIPPICSPSKKMVLNIERCVFNFPFLRP